MWVNMSYSCIMLYHLVTSCRWVYHLVDLAPPFPPMSPGTHEKREEWPGGTCDPGLVILVIWVVNHWWVSRVSRLMASEGPWMESDQLAMAHHGTMKYYSRYVQKPREFRGSLVDSCWFWLEPHHVSACFSRGIQGGHQPWTNILHLQMMHGNFHDTVDGCEILHHQQDGWNSINKGIKHLPTAPSSDGFQPYK